MVSRFWAHSPIVVHCSMSLFDVCSSFLLDYKPCHIPLKVRPNMDYRLHFFDPTYNTTEEMKWRYQSWSFVHKVSWPFREKCPKVQRDGIIAYKFTSHSCNLKDMWLGGYYFLDTLPHQLTTWTCNVHISSKKWGKWATTLTWICYPSCFKSQFRWEPK